MKAFHSYVEQCAGRAADFKIYYRKGGKPRVFFDVMWADTEEEAREKFLGFCRELGTKKVEIQQVVKL